MFSWFPLYFPLRDPVILPPGCVLGVNMWRIVGGGKVWYEWEVDVTRKEDGTVICRTPIHNPNGRSYQVGL